MAHGDVRALCASRELHSTALLTRVDFSCTSYKYLDRWLNRRSRSIGGSLVGDPLEQRSSTPRGCSSAKRAWPGCPCAIWLDTPGSRPRRCIRTSSRSTRYMTRCSVKAPPTSRRTWRRRTKPMIRPRSVRSKRAALRRFLHGRCRAISAAVPAQHPGVHTVARGVHAAVRALDDARERLARNGFTDPRQLDTWTALLNGLVDQQISNDPGGDRWVRLIDDCVTMFVEHARSRRLPSTRQPARSRTKGTKQ